jgi:hypothetical protein
MLRFKEYLLREENTLGYHNDGASSFNSRTGAYLPSEFTGSETFGKTPGHLSSTDLVIQDLPREMIKGKILKIDIKRDPCVIQIETNRGLAIQKITYDQLKSFVVGYTSPEEARGKNISLICQGHSKGVPQVRWGSIS